MLPNQGPLARCEPGSTLKGYSPPIAGPWLLDTSGINQLGGLFLLGEEPTEAFDLPAGVMLLPFTGVLTKQDNVFGTSTIDYHPDNSIFAGNLSLTLGISYMITGI